MARIQQTKNTYVQSWKVSWNGGEMSRSKAIEDHDDALKFKQLVEDEGELMPPIAVLAEEGLLKYADWVSPGFLIEMRKIIEVSANNDDAIKYIRIALDLLLDVPR